MSSGGKRIIGELEYLSRCFYFIHFACRLVFACRLSRICFIRIVDFVHAVTGDELMILTLLLPHLF
jgi:hypothetical protein